MGIRKALCGGIIVAAVTSEAWNEAQRCGSQPVEMGYALAASAPNSMMAVTVCVCVCVCVWQMWCVSCPIHHKEVCPGFLQVVPCITGSIREVVFPNVTRTSTLLVVFLCPLEHVWCQVISVHSFHVVY